MKKLFTLRNDIADEFNLPVYIVAGTNTIKQMADYLPINKKQLLQIDGFGDMKYSKFGEVFLDCIRDYCDEYGLENNMDNLPFKTKRERKEKPPKGASALVSLDMYRQGNDIKTIAHERKLVETTIIGHLLPYVLDGTLDIAQFISEERLEQMRKALPEAEKNEDGIFHYLKKEFSDSEIKFGLGYLRQQK
ncbi:MAG: helix-turn-helix domain-containing protein [Paludibacteraceae bacterium]